MTAIETSKLLRIALMLAGASGLICAQAPSGAPTGPQFDVASVKPFAGGGRGGRMSRDAGQFSWPGVSLRSLISFAYVVNGDQVTGPAWLDSEMYAVAVKIPEGATAEQFNTMLQNLLLERFRMAVHHETKVIGGYDLVVGKGGPKFKESVATEGGGGGQFGPDGATLTFNKSTIQDFANRLAMRIRAGDLSAPTDVGGPVMVRVVDKTGLTGIYDIKLHYSRPGENALGEDILSAVESQLGLNLKPAKVSVDMVVVDRAERIPTEN